MKTVTILLCLLFVAGCNGGAVALYSDNDTVGARVGTEISENIEAGILSSWQPYDDNDSQVWGAYSLYHFPDVVELPNPFGADPNMLMATTYIGAQISLDSNYDDYVTPVTGVIFQEVYFVEYQPGIRGEDKMLLGVRFSF